MTYQEQLKLYRANTSPYQARDFSSRERALLESHGFAWASQPSEADILVTNTHTNLDDFSSELKNNIKLIIHPNSGYDNFKPSQVKQLHCPIVIGNQIRAKAVTSYTMACLYNALGTPPWSKSWDKSRTWKRIGLEHLQIQLIGFGHVGKLIKQTLDPLVDTINVYDPFQNQNDLNLKGCDVLIFACSLNQENHHWLNPSKLSTLKDNCIIINPARGKLIDTDALTLWLKDHQKAQAYLDVFEQEPCDLSIFPQNLWSTPHIAGVDEVLDERIMSFVAKVSIDYRELNSNDFATRWHNSILSNRLNQNFLI